MKKSEQVLENTLVEMRQVYIIKGGYTVLSEYRLRTCQASVLELQDKEDGNLLYLLCSYGTPIALIDCADCYDWLRAMSYRDFSSGYIRYGYSATSAHHIAKFMRDYGAVRKYTWREV